MNNNIIYNQEENLDVHEFIKILYDSGLSERRPIDDQKKLEIMCQNSSLIITARLDEKLIGIARSITDYTYCTYVSDLAVHANFQRQGIGKKLIHETHNKTPEARLILLAAPKAINYYPKIGFEKHHGCFTSNCIS
ncbi:GNAT family N-acetyltransferase [Flavobacteriales bacterium]|nr:GNAT family N-acetyltransferase [Flavobacteriales bacterium]